MAPLALIGGFALLGWGLFVLWVYKWGKQRQEVKTLARANASLAKTLREERELFELQIKMVQGAGTVNADNLNYALGRLRKEGDTK